MPRATTHKPDRPASRRILVLSGAWCGDDPETAFVSRGLAGALSRTGRVEVAVNTPPGGPPVADGLFDLVAAGGPAWAAPEDAAWDAFSPPDLVVTEADDLAARHVARTRFPAAALLTVAGDRRGDVWPPDGFVSPALGSGGGGGSGAAQRSGGSPFGAPRRRAGPPPTFAVGTHVPVNPLAAGGHHAGLGFTGYLLVLSERGGDPGPVPPTDAVAWLTAALPTRPVVVVEGGSATVWRGRARRGTIAVATRADLWRLMAHGRMTVDLAPGRLVARECVESLRYGVPVVVPAGSVGAALPGDGVRPFSGPASLVAQVDGLDDPAVSRRAGVASGAAIESTYGDPDAVVRALKAALLGVLPAA